MKLKHLCLLLAGILPLSIQLSAQTANQLIDSGRAALAAHDLSAANSSFAAAVNKEPNNPTANVFYAASRVLVLSSAPATGAFLDRLGFSAKGRNIYNWTSSVPKDKDGRRIAPPGMSAYELIRFLRTNALPEISAAAANFAKVQDANFILNLTAKETTTKAVTLDYGDILLVRSTLYFAEYFLYTIHSWNLDAQLTTLRSLFIDGNLDAQHLLVNYPELLTFASTSDMTAAKAAFVNAADLYAQASEFIRCRPTRDRLFSLDPDSAGAEAKFRTSLRDLRASLDGIVRLELNPAWQIDFGRMFSSSPTIRDLLPGFQRNTLLAGTLPDATFGGLFSGLTRSELEQKISKNVRFAASFDLAAPSFSDVRVHLNTVAGKSYFIEESHDLRLWTRVSRGVGGEQGLTITGLDPADTVFFRATQSSSPANDNFANRTPVVGSEAILWGSNVNASREPDEPAHSDSQTIGKTVWWSWTAPSKGIVLISSSGSSLSTALAVYTGDSLASLNEIAHGSFNINFSANGGTTYQIAVGGLPEFFSNEPSSGSIKLKLKQYPPAANDSFAQRTPLTGRSATVTGHNVGAASEPGEPIANNATSSSSVWWTWTAPDSGRYNVRVDGFDSRFAASVYTGNSVSTLLLVGHSNGGSINFDARSGVSYQIAVTGAYNDVQGSFLLRLAPTLTPSNDSFAARTRIDGNLAVVRGSNRGATQEPGESTDPFSSRGSVWWTWTAPSSGAAILSSDGSDGSGSLQVYTGNSLGNLQPVQLQYSKVGSSFSAAVGTEYQIAFLADPQDEGAVCLRLNVIPAPPNDNLAAAAVIASVSGSSVTVTGSLLGATPGTE